MTTAMVETPRGRPAPSNRDAEESIVAQLLRRPKLAGEIVGTMLEPRHFYSQEVRVVFEAIVERYFADEPYDAVSISHAVGPKLAQMWVVDIEEAQRRVTALARADYGGRAKDHATLVRQHSDRRELLKLLWDAEEALYEGQAAPEEIAATLTQQSMQVATNTLLTQELVSYGDVGRNFLRRMAALQQARLAGVELGAYFGIYAIDMRLKGFKPTELWIIAGDPGVGKSAVAWCAIKSFAVRQHKMQANRELAERTAAEQKNQPPPVVADERIGALVLSLEMGPEPSEDRLAQELTAIDGGKLREGDLTEFDLKDIKDKWRELKDLRLYFNFSSVMRASQMRALVAEAIRRHNIGVVVIDHFRYFDLDRRIENRNDEDEEKARFLKENIAKDLNVAVVVLAHTTKTIDARDRRPTLNNLRGSGQVAAHADFVSFVYRPILHASQSKIDSGAVKATDLELLWEKNRHGLTDRTEADFNPSVMRIEDKPENTIPF